MRCHSSGETAKPSSSLVLPDAVYVRLMEKGASWTLSGSWALALVRAITRSARFAGLTRNNVFQFQRCARDGKDVHWCRMTPPAAQGGPTNTTDVDPHNQPKRCFHVRFVCPRGSKRRQGVTRCVQITSHIIDTTPTSSVVHTILLALR